ncbi:tRNAdihydrouridine synthase A, putative [Acanthamoeba castellanii str. Neff]|uniref:tRNA-dihydrouridine synthase n=1 Tax=Acanthamoeba castellanii (strain ATCC 30010 / Neff) TaxID=1257118 RepID=L8GLI8_ACACF|nr:tRNAdihydrouridine synthase A, putative [Acanthamoeba castellanii str. Neff]ELR13061.1 tRNAdihydrouridine synthase A, putative [Acanthamoeba castellanii str. Neff]
MDCTDQHYRYLMRQITQHTVLYTEMVSTGAILSSIHAEHQQSRHTPLAAILARIPATAAPTHAHAHAPPSLGRLLGYSPYENPLVLQLGGNDPTELQFCAQVAQELGYDEVNLNVGCPSKNVKEGSFGAVLMKTPSVVASCVEAMKKGVQIPITVKHRIGVDEMDSYEQLRAFVHTVSLAGCDRFIIHARKAWLKGLSPKENRTIPPLIYDYVYRIKQEFPALKVELNGEVKTIEDIHYQRQQVSTIPSTGISPVFIIITTITINNWFAEPWSIQGVDGVMIGRAAYSNPFLFAALDREFFGSTAEEVSRRDVVLRMIPGAKNWKKHLSERHAKTTTPLRPDVLLEALELTNHAALSSLPLAWQAQSAATSAAHP